MRQIGRHALRLCLPGLQSAAGSNAQL